MTIAHVQDVVGGKPVVRIGEVPEVGRTPGGDPLGALRRRDALPQLSHAGAHAGLTGQAGRTMRLIRAAIVLAALGVILCLWLLVRVSWYNFVAFMLLAQPLLLIAALIFLATAVKELRQKGVL
jgi:hypothetical protein